MIPLFGRILPLLGMYVQVYEIERERGVRDSRELHRNSIALSD
jgi:hypothetical protein